MEFDRTADGDKTWLFSSPSQPPALIREGTISEVTVGGRRSEDDVIPDPWGLLVRLEDEEAFIDWAVPGTTARAAREDGGEQIECDTSVAHLSLTVHPSGFVCALTITVAGQQREHLRLCDVEVTL